MRWEEIIGQDRAVRLLRTALERGQVHHAYLLAGPAGVGKELLARTFAQAANCEAEDAHARPCNACGHCAAIARGNFPDVFWLHPQAELIARGLLTKADLENAPSKEIRVDEIRALGKRLSLTALRGRRKIAVLCPADAINERAQNALLKTLEEPPKDTTFLLLSSSPDALLPTIRSRCARVQLGPVAEELIAARLVRDGVAAPEAQARAARAQGSFARALDETGDAAAVVQGFEAAVAAADERGALDFAEAFSDRDDALPAALLLQAWTRDLLVAQAGGRPELRALEESARGLGLSVTPRALLAQAALCADVVEALEQNGNGRLQLERLCLRTRELREGSAHV